MRSFLDYRILDNTIENYLYVAGAILLAVLIKRFISRYLAGLLYSLVVRAGKKFNKDAFCELVKGPLEVFLLILVIIVAFSTLNYPARWDLMIYKLKLSDLIEGVAKATMIIVFIWLWIRIIDFLAISLAEKANFTKSQSDNQLIVFFKDFLKVLLVIAGILMLIHFVFQKNIGSLLTGLSIVGAAIALATRESLENLIASFIIFFDKPFVTGDTVKVHNFTGTVERIGLRSTRIRTVDKTYISVPNKQMVDSIVDNISLRTHRKAEMRLELRLSVSTPELRRLLNDIRELLGKPPVQKSSVYFSETGKNANVITVEYFTGMELSEDQYNTFREQLNFSIMELIEQRGIDFATLTIDPQVFNRPVAGSQ
ncbi:MAG TPA: mechanosensitive ion channel domain-containing protein [Chitinophagaceae bacterium]